MGVIVQPGQPDDLQLLMAERARTNYIRFVRYVFKYIYRKPFRENWHHGYMAEHLEACWRRELLRLIMNIPPRYGKSEFSTILFDAWCKGLDPKFSYISASYSAELAVDHGVQTRNIIADPNYRLVFENTLLAKGMQEKAHWQTKDDGKRIAVGVGGTLTGKGASGIVMDDPHKPIMIELSEASRKRDIQWFENTLYTRLDDKKFGFIILTMQRLHDQDLTGYLLEQGDESGMDYTQISVAATNENKKTYSYGKFEYVRETDEPIWPAFEGEKEIAVNKRIMKGNFSAQYDQDPLDFKKLYFSNEGYGEFDYYNPPEFMNIYATCDYALQQDAGDWTVFAIWGLDNESMLYLLEAWREQVESDKWVKRQLDMQEEFSPIVWYGEKGQIDKSVGPFLRIEQRKRRIFVNMETFNPVGDKPSRCRSFQGYHNAGLVKYPKNAPWWPVWYNEQRRFPRAKNDDQVDNASLIGLALDQITSADIPGQPKKKSWRDRLRRLNRGGQAAKTWLRA